MRLRNRKDDVYFYRQLSNNLANPITPSIHTYVNQTLESLELFQLGVIAIMGLFLYYFSKLSYWF